MRGKDLDDFIRSHNGTGVVWEIGDESGVHELVRVVCRRIFYQRHVVAKLCGRANRRLHARMCYEPDDEKPVDAMLFEQRGSRRPTCTRRRPYYSTRPSGSVQYTSKFRSRPDGNHGALRRRREGSLPYSSQRAATCEEHNIIIPFCIILDARP